MAHAWQRRLSHQRHPARARPLPRPLHGPRRYRHLPSKHQLGEERDAPGELDRQGAERIRESAGDFLGPMNGAAHNYAMDPQALFIRDPKICGGQTVFRGTRVLLRSVLASLAEGDTVDEVLKAFPSLSPEHVHAAVAFAATRTNR